MSLDTAVLALVGLLICGVFAYIASRPTYKGGKEISKSHQ